MFLSSQFSKSPRPVRLYGTTPPRLGASPEEVQTAAQTLAARVKSLPVDALVVYDVQDESARTSEPRPFPFLPTLDSRVYSQILTSLCGVPVITYKSLGPMDEGAWERWLSEAARDFGIGALSVVGSPTRRQGAEAMSLTEATRMARAHPANFALGAVAIAERHAQGRSESQRMLQKSESGCEFFVSQSVYNAQKTIRLINDYARECRESGVEPRRFIFTFAPCGRSKTLDFIKWLGVSVPPEIERSILDAADPIKQSIEICRSILEEVLDGLEDKSMPLGVNVESVSIRKDEIDASIELFHVLDEVLTGFTPVVRS